MKSLPEVPLSVFDAAVPTIGLPGIDPLSPSKLVGELVPVTPLPFIDCVPPGSAPKVMESMPMKVSVPPLTDKNPSGMM